ncbi:MAG TPA: hypothetical protein VMT81_02625 [Candidatus Paceibacterota bacterium]|nr:hypothetical protein [Candidatus Paceibacterota bacterium]
MQGFIPLGEISSAATRSVELRRLTDRQTRVYQYLLEKLGNQRVPQKLEMQAVANRLRMSYKAVRVAKIALEKKGFIKTWTTTFKDPKKGMGFFQKATYYRIQF